MRPLLSFILCPVISWRRPAKALNEPQVNRGPLFGCRSLGVTVYVLLTGFSPFGGETDQETFCNISRAQVDFPDDLFEDVSEAAQDFVRRLLVRDPRYST